MTVSTQIAVRLPDELVTYVDELVAAGDSSRAAVVAKALRRYRRQLLAEQDAVIYRETGDYDDLEGWAAGGWAVDAPTVEGPTVEAPPSED